MTGDDGNNNGDDGGDDDADADAGDDDDHEDDNDDDDDNDSNDDADDGDDVHPWRRKTRVHLGYASAALPLSSIRSRSEGEGCLVIPSLAFG